jgi:hypothetical protein
MLTRRAAFRTKDGWVGLGPDHMQEGDLVILLFGGDVLTILRAWDGHYVLVRECYVEGMMYGEVMRVGSSCEGFLDRVNRTALYSR